MRQKGKQSNRAVGYGGVPRPAREPISNGTNFGYGIAPVRVGKDYALKKQYRRNRAVFLEARAKRKRQAAADRWFEARFGKKGGKK